MGRYLALTIRADANLPLSLALAGVFEGTPFVPVALGALAARGRADHWFLSGFAVEHFVSLFAARRRNVAAVRLPDAAGPERDYLTRVASALRAGRPVEAPGLFERRVDAAGATFIEGVSMGTDALAALDAWSAERAPDAVCLYGALPLAARDPDGLPWHRAFRCFVPGEELPAPLLFIRAGVSPFHAETLEVLVFSQADVWLRSATHPRVGPAQADENVTALASIVHATAAAAGGALRSVTLEVDGSRFLDERPRLVDAFSAIPRYREE